MICLLHIENRHCLSHSPNEEAGIYLFLGGLRGGGDLYSVEQRGKVVRSITP